MTVSVRSEGGGMNRGVRVGRRKTGRGQGSVKGVGGSAVMGFGRKRYGGGEDVYRRGGGS